MAYTFNDGSRDASAGSPLFPSLFTAYAVRPPWEVAGVDYAVGVASGLVLTDPATIKLTGVSVDAASHLIRVTGSGVTLSGYDFSLNGGWQIYISSGAANTVIENSNFRVGSNNLVPINAASLAGNLTVQHNTFDGGSSQSDNAWALINYNGSGTFTAEYNRFSNAPADAIDFSSGTITPAIRYNLFYNLGTSSGSHPDSVQFAGGASTNGIIAFNTIYQPAASGMQGIQLQAQNGATLTNTQIQNNVIIAKGPAIDMSYSIAVIQNANNTVNGAAVTDNYIDYGGAYGPFYPPSGSDLNFSGNINLVSGEGIQPTTTNFRVSDVTGVSATPPSGVEAVDNVITFIVSTDQIEYVTGVPTLSLNDGGTATFVGGSGTNKLAFSYVVSPTDKLVSNLGITQVNLPNGATIKNTYGDAANMSGCLTSFAGLGVTGGGATTAFHPVATADATTTFVNNPVAISVLANDAGGGGTVNPASVAVATPAAHGTTSINTTTGVVTYTPAIGFIGADSFQYTFADTDGTKSAPATVSVTVAQSSTAPKWADGAAGAASGPAQLPNLLGAYAVRPGWRVAGVDYAVGVPSGLSLKDPLSLAMAGVSVNASQRVVTISGNNVTLSGYDFGLEGGWQVNVASGANNTVIKNDNFSMGSSQVVAVNAASTSVGNLAVLNCSFNGNSANIPSVQPPPTGTGIGSAIVYNGSGSFMAEYNYIHDMPADGIDFNRGAVTPTIKYNLFNDLGTTKGAHPDPVQFYAGTVTNTQIDFNTIYSPQDHEMVNEGLAIESQGGGSITNTSMSNNVIIATGPSLSQSLNIGVFQDFGNVTSGVVVKDNYLDPTGAYDAFGSGGSTIQGNNLTFNGNINLVTGKETEPPQGVYKISDVSSVSATPSSGTQFPGTTVSLVLNMDQAEYVIGTPTLSLNTGGIATFTGGSGTSKLTFSYTVGSSDTTVPTLKVTGINMPLGASIANAEGDAANLSGAVTSLTGLGIDPPAPSGAMVNTASIVSPAPGPTSSSGSHFDTSGHQSSNTVTAGDWWRLSTETGTAPRFLTSSPVDEVVDRSAEALHSVFQVAHLPLAQFLPDLKAGTALNRAVGLAQWHEQPPAANPLIALLPASALNGGSLEPPAPKHGA